MALEDEAYDKLALLALRSGTAVEIGEFLIDITTAYNAAMFYSRYLEQEVRNYYILRPDFGGYRVRFRPVFAFGESSPGPEVVVPDDMLILNRVSIRSSGFFEFLGAINPLQQLREYLKDRHERKKDKDYRVHAERDRLRFENEILQRTIVEKDLNLIREQLSIARDFGVDEERIRQVAWERLGPSFARLGEHQDRELIGPPLNPDDKRLISKRRADN